jgi:S-adenosylmethionine:tRNA ribosyltransferase-isomerase
VEEHCVSFDGSYEEFRKNWQNLEKLNPKIHKQRRYSEDAERYQTIYAKEEGAVAAPTAVALL